MAQWKNTDDAANSVSWAAGSIGAGSGKAAQAANNTALFSNTTADAFITGQTIGQFGIDVNETAASNGNITHSGWVLVRTGSGGRAGRTTYETLVAGSDMSGDAEDVIAPDYLVYFTGSPSNAAANSSNGDIKTFTATALTTPAGGTITYKWQANTGSGFANVNNGAVYGNTTTAILTVANTTGLNGAQFRNVAFVTGAVNAISNVATLTVTT